jgi:hypothetical protein
VYSWYYTWRNWHRNLDDRIKLPVQELELLAHSGVRQTQVDPSRVLRFPQEVQLVDVDSQSKQGSAQAVLLGMMNTLTLNGC